MDKIFCVQRLVHSKHLARVNRGSVHRLPRHFDGYNICYVSGDGTAILLNGRDANNVIYDEDLIDVVAVLVSPASDNNNIQNLDTTITINTRQYVMNEDARRDGMLVHAVVFFPKQEVDIALVHKGLLDYSYFKRNTCIDTVLVVSGVGASLLASGHTHQATAFAIGGALGMSVLLQLINQVDNIEQMGVQRVIGALRFVTTACVIGVLDNAFADSLREEPILMVWALLGFASFRIAILMSQ